ncbi:DUF3137 domain-containing protein [Rhabdaerophilum sp. SD176]|uniref:DUF3137 domain-containing protein n=1 Tax=Rhabdaerophilum sp. SD176 TaxID=2983548 RepID=UPI0024DFFBDD|nr:DUF3137 domain-containing protein [Rhabdaerophilum sp. SD176]
MAIPDDHASRRAFATLVEREILPRLAILEQERQGELARRRFRRGLVGTIAAGLALLALLAIDDTMLAAILCAFVAFGALTAFVLVSSISEEAFQDRVRAEICPPIAAFLGLRFDLAAEERPDLAPFTRSALLPDHDQEAFRNGLSGLYRGLSVSACDLWLTRREQEENSDGKTRWTKRLVFQGVIATLSLDRPAPGRIVIRGDGGSVINAMSGFFDKHFKGLMPVTIDHPAFESAFEVRADHPEAARAYISGAFLDALLAFARPEDGKPPALAAAFVEDRFLLAVSGTSIVAQLPLGASMLDCAPRLEDMRQRMHLPIRLVDTFLGPEGRFGDGIA